MEFFYNCGSIRGSKTEQKRFTTAPMTAYHVVMAMRHAYRFRHLSGRNIQVTFRFIPGKWVSTGTEDMSEAVRFADDFLVSGGQKRRGQLTFREFSEGFFTPSDPHGYINRNERRDRRYSPDHYLCQQQRLDNYLIPKWGPYLIDCITDTALEDWLLDLTAAKGKRGGTAGADLSNDTKNKILVEMRIILQEAKREGYVSENAAERVAMLPARGDRRLPFSSAELTRMFPEDDDELVRVWGGDLMWACYFLVMRDTGFRPGEVAGLSKSCYVRELHGLYTMQSVNIHRELRQRIKTTGKGFGYKVGIVTRQTSRLLDMHIATLRDDMLFTVKGRLIRPEIANKHMRGSLRRAGVPLRGRSQYSLRHSFETDVAGAVEDKVLLELMAHTGYRPEYDHRTPEKLLEQLQPIRPILEGRARKPPPDKTRGV